MDDRLIQEPQVHKPLVARPPSAGKTMRPSGVTKDLTEMEVLPTINVIPPSFPQDKSNVLKLRPSSPASTAATSLPSQGSWPSSPFDETRLPKINVDLLGGMDFAQSDVGSAWTCMADGEDEDLRAKLRNSLDAMLGTCMRLCNAGVAMDADDSPKLPDSAPSKMEDLPESSPDQTVEIVDLKPCRQSLNSPSLTSVSAETEETRRPPSSPTRRLREALERGKALATEVLDLPVPTVPDSSACQPDPAGTIFFDEKTMFFDRPRDTQKDLELAALRSELRSALEREEELRRLRSTDSLSAEGNLLELRSRLRLREEIVKAKTSEIASLRLELQRQQPNCEEQRATSAEERLKDLEELNVRLQLELEDMRKGAASRDARKEYPRYQRRHHLALDFMPWRPSSARSARTPL